jgi:hypothetical protein
MRLRQTRFRKDANAGEIIVLPRGASSISMGRHGYSTAGKINPKRESPLSLDDNSRNPIE